MGFTTILKQLRFYYGSSFKKFVKVYPFRRRLWVNSFMEVDLEIFSDFCHSKPLIMRDNGHFFFPHCHSYLSNLVSLGSLKPYTLGLKPNSISYHCNLDLVSHFIFLFRVSCSINSSVGNWIYNFLECHSLPSTKLEDP